MTGWRGELEAMVRADLPPEVAGAFARLPLRPAVRLSHAGEGDPVVGHLGGPARLPVGMPWPVLGGWPLMLIAALDCAALAAHEVDLALPDNGSLLFFLPHPEGDEIASPPVIYVPEGTATADQYVPEPLRDHWVGERGYPFVPLTGRTVATAPRSYSPALGVDLESIQALSDLLWHQSYGGTSVDEVIGRYLGDGPDHQVGGHSDAFQHPLEISAAYAARRSPMGSNLYEDPTFLAEAREWVTLLQLDEDTDARMGWGDGGIAMWAIRRDDLARQHFDAVFFTVDSH